MTHRGRLSTPCRRRLRAEGGFAVPTVMLAVIAAAGIASSAVIASVNAQRGTARDHDTKAALATAEAGVANALLRYNRIGTTSAADACKPLGGTVVGLNGWCPQTVTAQIDRGIYSYRVRPTPALGATPAQITIASTGTVGGTSRRVRTLASTISENYRPFGEASVIGLNSIYLNSNAVVNADVATNGNIGIDSNARLSCGWAQVGIGRGYSPRGANSTATCDPVQEALTLPPVNPGDVLVNNSNARICNPVGGDPIQGQSCASAWNAATRVLDLRAGSSITLGAAGGQFNYAFCSVTLRSNSHLIVANGADVRIYFLSPDSPPCSNVTVPLTLNSNSKIRPTGTDPTKLTMLVVGSDTRTTRIELRSNSFLFGCDQSFVLYAPKTDLTISSNVGFCGATAAKTITLASNTQITASSTADEFELPGVEMASHYGQPTDFVECGPAPPAGGLPDAGC